MQGSNLRLPRCKQGTLTAELITQFGGGSWAQSTRTSIINQGFILVNNLVIPPYTYNFNKEQYGGRKGSRTPDIELAKLALYQLSYPPTKSDYGWSVRLMCSCFKKTCKIWCALWDSNPGPRD